MRHQDLIRMMSETTALALDQWASPSWLRNSGSQITLSASVNNMEPSPVVMDTTPHHCLSAGSQKPRIPVAGIDSSLHLNVEIKMLCWRSTSLSLLLALVHGSLCGKDYQDDQSWSETEAQNHTRHFCLTTLRMERSQDALKFCWCFFLYLFGSSPCKGGAPPLLCQHISTYRWANQPWPECGTPCSSVQAVAIS